MLWSQLGQTYIGIASSTAQYQSGTSYHHLLSRYHQPRRPSAWRSRKQSTVGSLSWTWAQRCQQLFPTSPAPSLHCNAPSGSVTLSTSSSSSSSIFQFITISAFWMWSTWFCLSCTGCDVSTAGHDTWWWSTQKSSFAFVREVPKDSESEVTFYTCTMMNLAYRNSFQTSPLI